MSWDPQAGFDKVRKLPEGYRRTIALAAWFQCLFPADRQRPVLVGGAAAEIYSGGAYTTGDLDFVGEVPAEVARCLEAAGFSRHGRHWVHEEAQVFIEMPGARLEPSEKAVVVRAENRELVVLSPEDVLVDRLAAWQSWRSSVDGAAAFWIWRHQADRLEQRRLDAAAERRQVREALQRLRAFAAECSDRNPGEEEVTAWARTTF